MNTAKTYQPNLPNLFEFGAKKVAPNSKDLGRFGRYVFAVFIT